MKKKAGWLVLTLALSLLLAGCGPKEPQVTPTPGSSVTPEVTVTPAPTPDPTATPAPWEEDPKGYVMGWLDRMLEGEEIYLRFWLHPGSGPTPSIWPTAEYAETVRAMFEELDWDSAKLLTGGDENAAYYDGPGSYNVTLHEDNWMGDGWIGCSLDTGVVRVDSTADGNLYFLVPGSEELCSKLTDLEPSVYVNMGRTRVPAQKSEEATLKLYLETALERTKELGHITDYELRAYAVTPPDDERTDESQGEHPAFSYTATYAFKPARPELFSGVIDADGWVVGNIEEYTEGLTYDEQDGCYGMY